MLKSPIQIQFEQGPHHRTTVDISKEAYEQAKEILGTSGYKETINAALTEVVRRKKLQETVEYIRSAGKIAPSPEELYEMRHKRIFG